MGGDDVIRSHSITGGKVPDSFGEASVCVAASHGDILKLRMLHEFGQKMHVCDYDDRFPLVCACECACVRVCVRACLRCVCAHVCMSLYAYACAS